MGSYNIIAHHKFGKDPRRGEDGLYLLELPSIDSETVLSFLQFFFLNFFFLGLVLNELRPVHLIKDGSRVRCQKISEQDLKPKGWNSPQLPLLHTHHAARYSLFYSGTLCCDEST